MESVDHLGVFVGNLDAGRICEAYQIRECLEGLAARLACEHAGRSDITELRQMAERVFELAHENKAEEMGSLDRHLHFHIIELSRNAILLPPRRNVSSPGDDRSGFA